MFRAFLNLPIGVKTSAASAMLLLCMVGLGLHALIVTNSLSSGLHSLASRALPTQEAVMAVKTNAIRTHVNVYRYVAWSSSGVNLVTLQGLAATIRRDAHDAQAALASLGARRELSERERRAVAESITKWERYATAVADTIDIAETDPALGTMMLGGTDEDYKRVAADLDDMGARVTTDTTTAAGNLVHEADRSKLLMAAEGLLAVLLGLGATVVVTRSVVQPIAAVTRALRADALGEAVAALASTGRRDEVGQMINAIAMFRDQIERDNGLLAAREQELVVQNARFDAALNNMSHGLAMFDANHRLIVCNAKYVETYRVPPELTKPGTTQLEILQHRVMGGLYSGSDPQTYIANRVRTAAAQHDADCILTLSDGRTIAVAHRVMPGGGWVSTHEDATQRYNAEQRIAHMARHDALTGLSNRVLFREEMERAFARAAHGETVAVLCIDLDHFKEVNDTLGHVVGDQLLVMVAERLRKCIREGDTIARLGGDEFAVIQRSVTGIDDATRVARRIVAALSEPYQLEGHETVIGTSIGIALARDGGASVDHLLRNADVALYTAKNDGRRTYRFFEPQMDTALKARHKLEAELRRAVQHDEFVLWYQPVVDLRTDQVTGFEALLRWNHPERGIIRPGEFVPLAEESGLICAIGEWVLHRACADASRWPQRLHVAINLSPAQFRGRTILTTLSDALIESGLAPSRLELEITESLLMGDNDGTIATLHDVRARGVRVSLDDFGTGYSSLSYLRRFPLDRIKIDRSFVADVHSRRESAAIVRAVVSLAATLGMATTAEGVETREQLDWLRAEGCMEAQGFLFSEPRPLEELGSWLLDNCEVRHDDIGVPGALATSA